MTKLAVYGTLRRNFGNYNYFLSDQEYLGKEVLMLPYKMVSLGGFPGLVPIDHELPVVVEIFNIDDEAFRGIDSLEGYPNFYNRVRINTSLGEAWIYYLNDPGYEALQEIETGDWSEFIMEKI